MVLYQLLIFLIELLQCFLAFPIIFCQLEIIIELLLGRGENQRNRLAGAYSIPSVITASMR